jgi:predicted enzyme related to lactoylglutathione lyase
MNANEPQSQTRPHPTGTIAWHDLTVTDAPGIRDFYTSVVGWQPEPLSMGEHDDFVMKSPAGDWVAGVCHARGENADLPPQWLVYIVVDDLVASLRRCTAEGGTKISAIKGSGPGAYCVTRDPAGAVLALMQRPE